MLVFLCLLMHGPQFEIQSGVFVEAIDGFGYEPFAFGAVAQIDYEDNFRADLGAGRYDKTEWGDQNIYFGELRTYFGPVIVGGSYKIANFVDADTSREITSYLAGVRFSGWQVTYQLPDDSNYATEGVTVEKTYDKRRVSVSVEMADFEGEKITGIFLNYTLWVF